MDRKKRKTERIFLLLQICQSTIEHHFSSSTFVFRLKHEVFVHERIYAWQRVRFDKIIVSEIIRTKQFVVHH